MGSPIGRGLAAGAVGAVALNAATYADMAFTGRPVSTAAGKTVLALARRLGWDPGGDDNRVLAYGALGGIGTGLAIGVAASAARSMGVRLPTPVASVAIGTAAMAASDLPMAALGVSDPRTWSGSDVVRDVVPHLAYGLGAAFTLSRIDAGRGDPRDHRPQRRTRGVLGRSLALGLAAGGRSSLGLLGPARLFARPGTSVAAGVLVASELVLDKLPSAPSRLQGPVLVSRLGLGGVGAAAVARREKVGWVLPFVVGTAGAWTGSVLGAAWRESARQRRGWTWQAAVCEDVASLALAAWAVR